MPLFYELNNDAAKIAIWRIAEEKNFFLEKVPQHRLITHPHKQLQHLAGRYLLQYLYPEFPYHLIEIADTRKPYLPNEEFHFSISHCGDFAAVIVSRDHRAGIDIELVSPKVEKIKNKFLNGKELEELSQWEEGDELRLLTLLWSCKEAVFKWYGNGGVDFRENIHLSLDKKPLHQLQCRFNKEEEKSLVIHCTGFESMSLAWVATLK